MDLLAVAAEVSTTLKGAQVDVAVPAEFADLMSLSAAVHRVIPVSPPEGGWGDLTAGDESEGAAAAAGLGGKLFSAAKKLSSVAGKNVRTYWQLAEQVRAVQYDAVFDFEFSAFSVAVAKLAKTQKVVGFDPSSLPAAIPGAVLTAHDTFFVKGEMSHSTRMRKLVAKFFDYHAAEDARALDWQLRPGDAPSTASPYMLVSASLPPPFLEVAQQGDLPVVQLDEALPAAQMAGMVSGAARVAGSGIATALAVAYGAKAYYIGSAADAPQRARLVSTPAELAQALAPAAVEEAPAAMEEQAAAPEAAPPPPKTIKLKGH